MLLCYCCVIVLAENNGERDREWFERLSSSGESERLDLLDLLGLLDLLDLLDLDKVKERKAKI